MWTDARCWLPSCSHWPVAPLLPGRTTRDRVPSNCWPITWRPTFQVKAGLPQSSAASIDAATATAATTIDRTGVRDPLHTPWGTVIFGEEAGSTGARYEMRQRVKHNITGRGVILDITGWG
jgi:hypothetical protein